MKLYKKIKLVKFIFGGFVLFVDAFLFCFLIKGFTPSQQFLVKPDDCRS